LQVMHSYISVILCSLLVASSLISAIDVAVPSYIYPGGSQWDNIVSAGTKVKIALINPLNGTCFVVSSRSRFLTQCLIAGPGFIKDMNYANQALVARAAGVS
jgi:hypothetical protein